MRLRELSPTFLVIEGGGNLRHADSIAGADGIRFACPKCFAAVGSLIGVHYIICWDTHVPLGILPSPGRWNLIGTGYDDLTLYAKSASVAVRGGCEAHFFVTKGEIHMCPT